MLHDVRFPVDIAFGSAGGPERRTEVVALASGREERNSPWAHSRRRYDAGYGLRSRADLERVVAFFEARRGRLHGFRWRDPLDHASGAPGATPEITDQVLGVGDGATQSFSVVKTYASGAETYARPIALPDAISLRVALDGIETNAFSLTPADATASREAAQIQFVDPPPVGVAVTAGFLFDVPARFDTDALAVNLAAFDAGEIPSIPILEIRL